MKYEGPHPSDRELLLDLEGELPPNEAKQIQAHMDSCWTCRARRQELKGAIADFICAHQQEMDPKIPPVAGPRALLVARLAEVSTAEPRAYEVDYLVTPALGGADDIRNRWPHYQLLCGTPRSRMRWRTACSRWFCEGSLDLMEAEQEIAVNWIAAYKKYFHTETPLEQHYKPEAPN